MLGELPDVHEKLQVLGSHLQAHYTTSMCLCIVSVLRRYHAYLLVMEEHTSPVFEKYVVTLVCCCLVVEGGWA